jgi:hypothetical protein
MRESKQQDNQSHSLCFSMDLPTIQMVWTDFNISQFSADGQAQVAATRDL